ncbi:MAG: hypothetical protein WD063_00720, partial [Pirellulales bacterium]
LLLLFILSVFPVPFLDRMDRIDRIRIDRIDRMIGKATESHLHSHPVIPVHPVCFPGAFFGQDEQD